MAVISTISLLLFSSYGIAGGTSQYNYICPSPDSDYNNYQCCNPQTTTCDFTKAGGDTQFNQGTSGITKGKGKHNLKPGQSKTMKVKCACAFDGDDYCPMRKVRGWGYWAQGKKINCTTGSASGTGNPITINCTNTGMKTKKFGLKRLKCGT